VLSLIFMNHRTLTLQHAQISIKSMKPCAGIIRNIIIYNSDPETTAQPLFNIFREEGYSQNIWMFNVESVSLADDVLNVINIVSQLENQLAPYVMLLKADYSVSANFSEVFKENCKLEYAAWTMSGMNAKEFVTDEEIQQKLLGPFKIADHETFYRGGTTDPTFEIGPLYNGSVLPDTDPRIHFGSHRIRIDYNVHVIRKNAILKADRSLLDLGCTWGGAARFMGSMGSLEDDRAFWIHKFHPVVSVNRAEDRGDNRKTVLGNRY
jgi:hypothetical protein